MKYQITMNSISGEYEASSEGEALDLFAKDAGHASWNDACSQGLASNDAVTVDSAQNSATDYASSESLWVNYIDPDNTTPFESVSYGERVMLARSVIDSNT